MSVGYFRKLCVIALKDLRIELRSRDLASTMLVLALVCVVLFRFAFDFVPTPGGATRDSTFQALGAGLIWVTIVFASVLGLDRSFALEREEGGLEGLLLAPVDRTALLLGKAAATLLLVACMEAVVLGAMVILYGADLRPMAGWLVAVLAVNTFGFVLVGTVVSFLAGPTRRGSLLLPVLQVPLCLPLLLFAVRGTGLLLTGGRPEAVLATLKLSGVVTAVYLGISLMVFDSVVEES